MSYREPPSTNSETHPDSTHMCSAALLTLHHQWLTMPNQTLGWTIQSRNSSIYQNRWHSARFNDNTAEDVALTWNWVLQVRPNGDASVLLGFLLTRSFLLAFLVLHFILLLFLFLFLRFHFADQVERVCIVIQKIPEPVRHNAPVGVRQHFSLCTMKKKAELKRWFPRYICLKY